MIFNDSSNKSLVIMFLLNDTSITSRLRYFLFRAFLRVRYYHIILIWTDLNNFIIISPSVSYYYIASGAYISYYVCLYINKDG